VRNLRFDEAKFCREGNSVCLSVMKLARDNVLTAIVAVSAYQLAKRLFIIYYLLIIYYLFTIYFAVIIIVCEIVSVRV